MADRPPSDQISSPINIRPPTFQRRYIAAATDDPDTLVALATDESYFVRRQAMDNPHTPPWVLNLLVRAGATPDLRGKGEIDPELDPDSLQRLAETGPWARLLVAEHPNTSTEVLDALKDQPSVALRLAIAHHPHASVAALAALCCDMDEAVRSKAWVHPNCPADLIQLFVAAGSVPNLLAVTREFGKISPDDFYLLARLGPWGRYLIARHPDCPVNLCAQISSDPEWRVRSGLLNNPHAPTAILERMLDAPNPEGVVTIQCLSQPQISGAILSQLVGHPSPEVRYALARHPATTTEILGLLVTDGIREIRRLAARHPKTDSDVIQRLVQAGSTSDLMGLSEPNLEMSTNEISALLKGGVWARQLAVRHPSSDSETLARLLCDPEPKIREWAAVHPNLESETKRDLIRAGSGTDFQGIMPPDSTLSPETLEKISCLGSWGEWVVANNPYAPPELLDKLAGSDDWQVRLFVAKNPHTSKEILLKLVNDEVAGIGQAAKDRI